MVDLTSLLLTGVDIKELTDFPDAMVEDYLNITRNLGALSEALDELLGSDADNAIASEQIRADAAKLLTIINGALELIELQSNQLDDLEQLTAGL